MNWKPQPSKKHPAIEATILAAGFNRKKAITEKSCVFCNKEVTLDSFKDELSLKEFHISGICQPCQDETFKPTT